MRKFLAVMLMLGMAGTAFAGGGGTKANGRIEVKNLGGFELAVIVEDTQQALEELIDEIDQGILTPEEFENRGGKFLNSAERHTFRVERGQQFLGGLYLLGDGHFGEPNGIPIDVGSRKVKVEAEPRGDGFRVHFEIVD